MIRGQLNASLQAIVTLSLFGPTGKRFDYDCVIDTGFTGFMMLSPVVKAALGLGDAGRVLASLAGGHQVTMDLAEVEVEWQGQRRLIRAHVGFGRPLLGTSLMRGSRLIIDMLPGGDAHIDEQIGL